MVRPLQVLLLQVYVSARYKPAAKIACAEGLHPLCAPARLRSLEMPTYDTANPRLAVKLET